MNRPLKVAVVTGAAVVGLYVVASLALSGLSEARMSGNEASAIGSVRTVLSGQLTYASSACNGLYAPRLTVLGAATMVSPDLGQADVVEKAGYRITMRPSDPAEPVNVVGGCAGGVPGYVVSAAPLEPGTTGRRYFKVDETGNVLEATRPDYSDAKRVQ
jgi:type IV pilus assembly protein PilA